MTADGTPPVPSRRSDRSGDALPTYRWWRPRGVRLRLTLGYIAAILVVLTVYAAGVFTFVSRNMSEALDQQLRTDLLLAEVTVDEAADGTIIWSARDEIGGGLETLWLQVWGLDGALLYASPEAQLRIVPEDWELAVQSGEHVVRVVQAPDPVRLLSRRLQFMVSNRQVVIQVARTEEAMRQELRELLVILLFGFPLGVVVAGLGGYTLAWRALAPVERMAERARSITADRLHDRLPVDNENDELGHLATVFNDTLARLEASFEQMRRFTADVSHELRTPLTAIRSVGEVGLRERRTEDDYRGIVGSMLEEVDRLSNLVDRLLTLSRAETGQARLSLEDVDLGDLARDVVAHLGVLAEEKGQSVDLDVVESRCRGDRQMLRQALINLVDNAIKYTPTGGRIQVACFASPSAAVLEVSDSGPGIAAEQSAHVFDRFYQERRGGLDEGRGVGLGLAIAKWAVEVNGGQLSLEQRTGEGCTFRMTLPRARQG